MSTCLIEVVSGGQTGVDRAALDAALAAGLAVGGWCPAGRRAMDGRIPGRYPLRETPSPRYAQRTQWNVRDSDGTLVLTVGPPTGGTELTVRLAASYGRPLLVVDLDECPDVEGARHWLEAAGIRILNVAGPREESMPGIQCRAADFLRDLFRVPAGSRPAAPPT